MLSLTLEPMHSRMKAIELRPIPASLASGALVYSRLSAKIFQARATLSPGIMASLQAAVIDLLIRTGATTAYVFPEEVSFVHRVDEGTLPQDIDCALFVDHLAMTLTRAMFGNVENGSFYSTMIVPMNSPAEVSQMLRWRSYECQREAILHKARSVFHDRPLGATSILEMSRLSSFAGGIPLEALHGTVIRSTKAGPVSESPLMDTIKNLDDYLLNGAEPCPSTALNLKEVA